MNTDSNRRQFIAHYRVERHLGSGGMGEVFLAEDIKLDRLVALKLLPKEVAADAGRRKRFLAEAKAVSALNHSNICTIYEAGETAEGQPFIAMEYLEGQTLDALARRRRLELREIAGIGMQVAEALEAARQSHVVHRDIKPGNIVVLNPKSKIRNPNLQVKVVDFGLAKRLDQSGEASVMTQEGAILGTPDYLSPEMALGREVDSRTDIFSLGVLLYELAAGKNPFAGASFGETVNNILNNNPDPMKPWNPNVTPGFERIVFKCLEKDPAKRYGTPAQLRDELGKLHASLQTQRSSNRMVLAVAAIVVALGVIGLGVTWLTRARPAAQPPSPGRDLTTVPQKSVAVLPFVNLSSDKENEYLSDGLTEDLCTALTQVKGLRVPARTSSFVFKGKTDDIRKIGEQLSVATVLEGSVTKAGNRLRVTAQLIDVATGYHLWATNYDREIADILEIRSEIAQQVVAALKVQLGVEETHALVRKPTENLEAYKLYLQGRYLWNRRTGKDLKQAIQYFDQAIAKDPGYALAYAGLADCYVILNLLTELPGRETIPKARAAALKALELDDSLAEPPTALAFIRSHWDWDWSGSEADFRRVIASNPNYATARHWLSVILSIQGRDPEALAEIKKAQEIDPLSPVINAVLGIFLFNNGKADQAIELLQRQIAFDPSFVGAHNALGGVYFDQGKWSEAIAEFETAHRLEGSGVEGLSGFGALYARAGRTNEAQKILTQTLELQQQGKADYRLAIAAAQHALGNDEAALDWLEKALTEHSADLENLNYNPFWKDLRPHPRVQAILRKMNLAPASATNTPSAVLQRSVAVLPFVNMSADKADEYLSDGMTEELLNALSKVRGLRVPGRSSSFAFKGKNEEGIFRRVGEQLHVSTVLEGSVRKAGNQLRITAQLINVADGFHLWSETYDRDMTNIFAIQSDIAQQVVAALKVQLDVDEAQRLVKKPTDNLEAYALCLQGRAGVWQGTSSGFTNAVRLFREALALDPGYALAYSGLADAYNQASDWLLPPRIAMEVARTNAEAALRLDGSLAEPHVGLSYLKAGYEYDQDGSKRECERALELAPNLADAYRALGFYHLHMKHFEEARRALRRAAQLDPLSPVSQTDLAAVEFYARDFSRAAELSRAAVAQFPESIWGHFRLAWVCEQLGQHAEAISEMQRARAIDDTPDMIGRHAHIYASAGQPDKARELLKQLEDRQRQAYVSPTFLAWAHLGLGQTNQAIAELQAALEVRDGFLPAMNTDPYYDPIRTDPRFVELLKKIGLPQ